MTFTASVIVALASFLPVLDFDFLRLKRKHGSVDSLLYFGSKAASYLARSLPDDGGGDDGGEYCQHYDCDADD